MNTYQSVKVDPKCIQYMYVTGSLVKGSTPSKKALFPNFCQIATNESFVHPGANLVGLMG